MPKAMPNAALAWSLGKDGSWDCVRWYAAGGDSYGRGRCQMKSPMSWLMPREISAETPPQSAAIFQRRSLPGGVRSQRKRTAAAYTTTPNLSNAYVACASHL